MFQARGVVAKWQAPGAAAQEARWWPERPNTVRGVVARQACNPRVAGGGMQCGSIARGTVCEVEFYARAAPAAR